MDVIRTTTTFGGLTTTSGLCLDKEGQVRKKGVGTTLGTTATTSTSMVLQEISSQQVLNNAYAYLESLSVEELAQLDELMNNKEKEFAVNTSTEEYGRHI